MRSVIATSPTRTPAFQDRDAADYADRDRGAQPSRLWVLLEALAYAGASIDLSAALAAQRFARIRDDVRHGRR
jgi:hypothetical protein